jgi:hypothetical protein
MLLNMDESSAGYAQRILIMLCCTKRPLRIPELIDAVAIELGDPLRLNPNTDSRMKMIFARSALDLSR